MKSLKLKSQLITTKFTILLLFIYTFEFAFAFYQNTATYKISNRPLERDNLTANSAPIARPDRRFSTKGRATGDGISSFVMKFERFMNSLYPEGLSERVAAMGILKKEAICKNDINCKCARKCESSQAQVEQVKSNDLGIKSLYSVQSTQDDADDTETVIRLKENRRIKAHLHSSYGSDDDVKVDEEIVNPTKLADNPLKKEIRLENESSNPIEKNSGGILENESIVNIIPKKIHWLPVECSLLKMKFRETTSLHNDSRNSIVILELINNDNSSSSIPTTENSNFSDSNKYDRSKVNKQYVWKHFQNPSEYTSELTFFMMANHPRIVKPVCILTGENRRPGIVMEYIPGDQSQIYFASNKRKFSDLQRVSSQLLDVLTYIHMIGFTHADLKPQNVMVDDKGDMVAIDFGFSIPCPYQKGSRGTRTTMAPELVVPGLGYKLSPALDIWAYGSTLAQWDAAMNYALTAGKATFSNLYEVESSTDNIPRNRGPRQYSHYVPLIIDRTATYIMGGIPLVQSPSNEGNAEDGRSRRGRLATDYTKEQKEIKKSHFLHRSIRQIIYHTHTIDPELRKFDTLEKLRWFQSLDLFEGVDWSTYKYLQ